jgi:FXSXX-COOH protein
MEQRPHESTEPDETVLADAGIDLSAMDLETLRTVEYPVLSAVLDGLRERVAEPGSEALWGFQSAV